MNMGKQTLIVYGDGETDDSDAIQAHMDGKADLVHADGSPYRWPGAPGRRYALGKSLILGGPSRDTQIQPMALAAGAWIGCR